MTDRLPAYDELPVVPGAPPASSWGVWDDGGSLGCLNLLTPERVLAAQREVRSGHVFNLNLELELPDPPLYGRSAPEHVVRDLRAGHDDELNHWNTQASSQWDGFRHIRHPRFGFYGGRAGHEHGVDRWVHHGIVGRAVLADVGRWRASTGRPLTPDRRQPIEVADLLGTLEAQGTVVVPGDILLVRTGWLAWYRGLDEAGRRSQATPALETCGLAAGPDMARALWDLHVAAVAADNPALEEWPPQWYSRRDDPDADDIPAEALTAQFLHFALLPLLGLPIGELFDLDALAEHAAASGRWTALFTSAPLNLAAGVASPPNALAIV